MTIQRHRHGSEPRGQSRGHCGADTFAPMLTRVDQRGREAEMAHAGKEQHEGKV